MGHRSPRSTVLCVEEEAVIVAFSRYTRLPLDDCLWVLQPTIPRPTRSSLHGCLQHHGICRLPDVKGDRPTKKKFKSFYGPILAEGSFHPIETPGRLVKEVFPNCPSFCTSGLGLAIRCRKPPVAGYADPLLLALLRQVLALLRQLIDINKCR
jgi:hypothetical protein